MPQFLVERYVPRLDGSALASIAAQLERATEELTASGHEVRWLRSVAALEDETCFCFFDAQRLDEVVAANEHAGLEYERVAMILSIETTPSNGSLSPRSP
jgi:Protein of unknown function (DUF4242)